VQYRTPQERKESRQMRLLICDDSAPARQALRAMLDGQAEIEIVGEAADGREAIELGAKLQPDVVLMDVSMPVIDGVTATRSIREVVPATRVVAFAGSDDVDVVMAMMDAGASAYCVKGAPLWELERAIIGAHDPLLRIARGLARSLHGGAAELVANELADLTGAALAAVYLTSGETGLSLAAAAGPASRTGSFGSPPGVAVRSFYQHVLAKADAHEVTELYRDGLACAEAIAVPLLLDGEPLGAIFVATPATVTQELDVELVSSVSDLVAASIANERRMALTFAEARRDALTGLANKRAFDESLDEAIGRAQAEGSDVALVLLDLDNFKTVNDTDGHPVGDQVLREAGRLFLRVLRVDEEIFRIGGDEFAIVLESGAESAALVVERVQHTFHEQRRGHSLPTLSAGVASMRGRDLDKDELIRRADVALYAGKRAGRNRVVVYGGETEEPTTPAPPAIVPSAELPRPLPTPPERGARILIVDDDASLRLLLKTTFELVDIEVDEAEDGLAAAQKIALSPPDVIVLDVDMPRLDGIELCRKLKHDPETWNIGVVLLTGSETGTVEARDAGADALVNKPFSPLDLLAVIEQVSGGLYEGPFRGPETRAPGEQLLLYAQDLRRLLDVERRQRALLQRAYRQTVSALASALDSKDTGTRAHSQRVQQYAAELARVIDPSLLGDPSVEYGFLLHDVGKIGIPDRILHKPAALTPWERRLMQTHTILGEQMLDEVALLQGEGLKVVRHHHERWDGRGYPDGLDHTDIPLGARIFAVADALDAMTSDRPYRPGGSWDDAVAEIVGEAEHQSDPDVVEAFRDRETTLRRIRADLSD
jgi:diguanylate cyclase (GGDEF)-like protein